MVACRCAFADAPSLHYQYPARTFLGGDIPMTVDRDTLYQLVWAEPMTKVAARYGVSSSFPGAGLRASERAAAGAGLLGPARSRQGAGEARSPRSRDRATSSSGRATVRRGVLNDR